MQVSCRERAEAIATGYETIRAAWELASGSRYRLTGPADLQNAHSFLSLLGRGVHEGPSLFKEVAHGWRARSLNAEEEVITSGDLPLSLEEFPPLGASSRPAPKGRFLVRRLPLNPSTRVFVHHREVPATRLFAASTLTKAIPWDLTYKMKSEVEAKIDAWYQEPLPCDDSARLYTFARTLMADCKNRQRQQLSRLGRLYAEVEGWEATGLPVAPTPNSAASVEAPRSKGGCRAALLRTYQERRQRLSASKSYRRRTTVQAPVFPENPGNADLYRFCEYVLSRTTGVVPLDPTGLPRTYFRAIPLQEVGKIRVATVHTSTQAHFGRAISGETVPLLARHPWFRAGLTDGKVTLRGEGKLLSADLTAATEWLSQERAVAIMDGIADALSWSDDKRKAAKELVGPQTLVHEGVPRGRTKNSVLLGLGVSWTCLSILNAYNAVGGIFAEDPSFAICGDDLIGLWEEERRKAFFDRTVLSGLRINRKKSYCSSTNGVFCERYLTVTAPGLATEIRILGLREATAAKLRFRGGQDGVLSVREGLTRALASAPRPLKKIIQRALQQTTPPRLPAGPAFLGGNGGPIRSNKDAKHITACIHAYIRKGPLSLVQGVRDEAWREVVRHIRDLPPTQGGTPTSSVLMAAQSAMIRADLTHIRVRPVQRPIDAITRIAKARARDGAIYAAEGANPWYAAKVHRVLTRKGLRLFRHLSWMLRKPNPRPQLIAKVAHILQHHRPDPLVNAMDAAETVQSLGLRPPVLQTGQERPWGFLRPPTRHRVSETASEQERHS